MVHYMLVRFRYVKVFIEPSLPHQQGGTLKVYLCEPSTMRRLDGRDVAPSVRKRRMISLTPLYLMPSYKADLIDLDAYLMKARAKLHLGWH